MTFRCRKLLDLAEGESCTNCDADDGTIVAAHSNMGIHGKGMSEKAHDCFVAFLCHRCHSWLDQGRGPDPTGLYLGTRYDKDMMFQRAMEKTWLRLWQKGRVRVA